MHERRKDEGGGLAVIVIAGCLVIALVFSLLAVGTYLEYRTALVKAKARQAAQLAQFQKQQSARRAAALKALADATNQTASQNK